MQFLQWVILLQAASVMVLTSAPDETGTVPLPMVTTTNGLTRSSHPSQNAAAWEGLTLVAEIQSLHSWPFELGDSDHDAKTEIIVRDNQPCSFIILEHEGDNAYTQVHTGPCVHPYVMADLDKDGLTELVTQYGSMIEIYESADANSHPTELVWTSIPMTNVDGYTAVADTDQDGKLELIHSANTLGGQGHLLHIFENEDDNHFVHVYSDTVAGNAASRDKIVGDWDSDGFIEIIMAGVFGWIHVYESEADNSWRPVWNGYTGLLSAYAVAGGLDSDNNGKPEFFVLGDVPHSDSPTHRKTFVFESVCDDSFACVDTFSVVEPWLGRSFNAVADIDLDGTLEYLADLGTGLYVFQATSPGNWEQVGCIPASSRQVGFKIYDANGNGIPELIWRGTTFGQTWILEPDPATQGEPGSLRRRFSVFPNPIQTQTRLAVPTDLVVPAVRLSVYRADGRLAERVAIRWSTGGTYSWRPEIETSGIYFVRLENARGEGLASARVLIQR